MEDSRALPEVRVTLTRLDPGEKAYVETREVGEVDWTGRRTKLGGEPHWIQSDETPTCKACGESMVFVAQIDSIDCAAPMIIGEPMSDDYMFGDCGMLYVFHCFECMESSCVSQCH